MERRRFGRTGLQVSVLGFGAAPVAYLDTDAADAAALVNELLDAGVNVIDTAASYPGCEEFIGQHLSNRRRDFVLISKCGMNLPESDALAWSENLILTTVDRSLRLLQTDVIDVMLLHSCDVQTLERGEAIAALAKARDAGKIRFAGYSGDNDAAEFAAAHPDIAVIETSINMVDQMNLETVLPEATLHHCGVIAKRPLANAAWKDDSQQHGTYRDYAREYSQRLRQMRINPRDLGFTSPAEQAWPELALRFTLGIAGVHTAIVGTTDPQNARKNIEYAANGPLPPRIVEKLRESFRHADPNQTWLGQT